MSPVLYKCKVLSFLIKYLNTKKNATTITGKEKGNGITNDIPKQLSRNHEYYDKIR
jgi:hypothetical protein